MKILITGADGQLGKACKRVYCDHELFLGSHENFEQCRSVVESFQPDLIVHGAAYTNVKEAETNQKLCYEVNVAGTTHLCEIVRAFPCTFVYVSTDFIFDGKKTAPYEEDDAFNPLNVYGRSKIVGELLVRDLVADAIVVRTSWVFGEGKNFVKTISTLAAEVPRFKILDDQVGSPTYAVDLAGWIMALVQSNGRGIYHACNAGSTNWASYAEKILSLLNRQIPVTHITTEEYMHLFNDFTPKPKYSVLNTSKLQEIVPIRPWEESLADYIQDCIAH
jgi:dTDP-4-dehydrorhamnose reductase